MRAASAYITASPRRGYLASVLLLAGCATYHPVPLPASPNLAREAPGGVAPLDMERVATVAVLNSPTLRTARATFGVAQAQAFAAGLLPDPHFSYNFEHPYDHVLPPDPRYPEYNAYGLELDIDLLSLLTHSSVRASARGDLRNAQLQLLWQEWQTVAEARTLYVEQSLAGERRDFLAHAQQIYALAAQHSQSAQAAGNATLEQTSADLAVLQDVGNRLGEAERSLLTAQQEMHALLGVDPGVQLPLQTLLPPRLPSRSDVEAGIAVLAQRRPDLLALQAGYGAEEERVRTAVLSQFPNVVIGFTKARDNSNVHSYGGLVNLNLPLFNRGRGPIAIERATREQLRADYQARLDQATGDVWHLWNELQQVQAQLTALEQQQPALQRSVDAAERAYRAAEFPAASYLTLVGSYLAAQELHATLTQSLWSDSIALATVLGTQVQPNPQSPIPAAAPSTARAQPAPSR
jgi:outer membrane protein TolC